MLCTVCSVMQIKYVYTKLSKLLYNSAKNKKSNTSIFCLLNLPITTYFQFKQIYILSSDKTRETV